MADILQTSVEYLTGKTDSPSPTCFVIKQGVEPELFELVLEYKNASVDMQRRLLEYAKRLITSN